MDILIKNARILDGAGNPGYIGNIGIEQGKLRLTDLPETADLVIDAQGKCLAPGFIDAHSHGDANLGGADSGALCKINQGVTTQVVGQCGQSSAPTSPAQQLAPIISVDAMDPRLLELTKAGLSWAEYMDFARQAKKVTHFKFLAGFNSIRVAVMGFADRAPAEAELEQMKDLLRQAMEGGAVGMSSGLAYVPATYSTTRELIELCKVMAPYGGIYTTHMRNESFDLLASVEEAIEIGRQSGVPVHISHFKVMGRSNWGKHRAAVAAIEKARAEGLDITCDQYPYNCSMTTYMPCMPPWHFSSGVPALLEKLKDPAFRAEVKAQMLDPTTDYENIFLNAGGWDGVTLTLSPNVPQAEGMTIADYAKSIGKDPFDAYFDIAIANQGLGSAVYHSIGDEDIEDIIRLPYVMVGSDGLVSNRYDKCHPRGWGTMVRAICHFVKDRQLMPLEQLIHRMTGLSALRYKLANKGFICEGYDADLVLFDYETLTDRATYADPTALAEGIELVFVDGQIVYQDGKLTGLTPGRVL